MPTVVPLRSGDPRRVGRYRLTGRLQGLPGAGGSPDAFLGRAIEGERVAITLVGRERAADGAARDRFTAEARAARRVDPFCVTRIVDAGLDGGEPYLVSEYVPGASLAEICAGEGPLTGAPLMALAIGTATGLAAIHQASLVHGAFGPDHVVLGSDGPRVVDFSITPPYGAATPAADMTAWALAVLYAAIGRPSVGPQDLAALPEPLRPVVAACLAPDPAARPTARAVLTRLLDREDPSAGLLAEGTRRARSAARDTPRTGPRRAATRAARAPGNRGAGRAARQPRSRAVVWGMACVACLAAIAGAGWFISAHPGAPRAGLDSASRPAAGTRPVTVPAALAGTWAGQVHQTAPVLAVTVRITMAPGARGGTIGYPALGCSGVLRAVSGQGGTLTLSQRITQGRQNCQDGVVTLTAQGGQLSFSFRRPGGPSPAGVLARVAPSAPPAAPASPSPSPS